MLQETKIQNTDIVLIYKLIHSNITASNIKYIVLFILHNGLLLLGKLTI